VTALRIITVLFALLSSCLSLPLLAQGTATFTIDVRLNESDTQELTVLLQCAGEKSYALDAPVDSGDSITFNVPMLGGAVHSCTVSAEPLAGKRYRYAGDGGSLVELGEAGCTFSQIEPGHANFCQIQIEQTKTRVTVFKRWIGTSEAEKSTKVTLSCNSGVALTPRMLNIDAPARWELDSVDAEGIVCSVSEQKSDSYIDDVEDCQGLLIRPGVREECTIVNTKVVKMIEMLNRYGLVLMILAFMAVGGFAVRRII
jgi:hypothetical protein